MHAELADGTPIYAPLGILPVDDDGRRVQCHLCGRWLKQITAGHLRRHGIDRDTYRDLIGLKRSNPLQAPELSRRRALIMRRQMQRDPRIRDARFRTAAVGFARPRRATLEERLLRRDRGATVGERRVANERQRRHTRAKKLGFAGLEELLRDRYVRDGASLTAVAVELGASTATVRKDLAHFGIPTRDVAEAMLAGPRAHAQQHRERRSRRLGELGFATLPEYIAARKAEGATYTAMAAELGIHERTLGRLRAAGALR